MSRLSTARIRDLKEDRSMMCTLYIPDQTKDEPICVACGRHALDHVPSFRRGPAALTPEKYATWIEEEERC